MTADPINTRKLDHLRALEADPEVERNSGGFDRLRLTHRALPELNLDDVDLSVSFLGKTLSMPLLISSMTGGAGAEISRINHNLAVAAETCGVALAVGSQRVMFSSTPARDSFDLRKLAPNTVLLGNIGAVQLNTGMGIGECQQAVDILQADGLYLHLNPLQEAIQPEGDRNFADLTHKITDLSQTLSVPLLLKEVGAGLSPVDIERGITAGIRHFDVAGRGGTSWSRIEYHRRTEDGDDLGLVFQDWGLTTVEALLGAAPVLSKQGDCTLIASGGIRSGIDIAKAMILGANLAGLAAPFLAAAQHSAQAVIAQIEQIRKELRTAMFLLGCDNCDALRGNTNLLLRQPL